MAGWPRKVISKEKFSGKWPSGWAEGIGQLKWPSSASLRGGPQASYSSSPGKSSRVGMPSVLAWPTLNARSPSGVLWGQKPGPSGTPACPPRTPRAFRTSTGSAAERSRGGQRWGTARTSPGLQDGGSGFFWGGLSLSLPHTMCLWLRKKEQAWAPSTPCLLITPQMFRPQQPVDSVFISPWFLVRKKVDLVLG